MKKILKCKRILAIVLVIAMIIPSNIVSFALDAITEPLAGISLLSDEDESGFYINIDWGDSKFINGSSVNIVESSNTTNAVKLRVSYGNYDVAKKTYEPGDLIITVKGIGKITRDGVKEATVGADKELDKNKTRDWSYTWNKAKDTYTFTNNNTITENSVFSGYFDMIWDLHARSTIDGYAQEDVKAQLLLPNGETVSSNTLKLTNDTTCDTFSIDIDRDPVYSSAGIAGGLSYEDYVFVKYTIDPKVSIRSRGLSESRYYFDSDVTDLGAGGIITYANVSYSKAEEDGCYWLELKDNSSDIETIVVAYDKETYANQLVEASVNHTGVFYEGTDGGVTDEVILAEDSIKFIMPSDFDFEEPTGIFSDDKESEYEYLERTNTAFSKKVEENGGQLAGSTMNAENVQTFYYKAGVSYVPRQAYSVEFVDDFIYITQNNADYRQLTAADYEYESIDIVSTNNVLNENKVPISSGKYTVKIFAFKDADAIQTADDTYLVWKGLWRDYEQHVRLPEGTTKIAIRFEGLEEVAGYEKITKLAAANIKFHLDEDDYSWEQKANLVDGHITNIMFTDYYDANMQLISDKITDEIYIDNAVNIDFAKQDEMIYGRLLNRTKAEITLYSADKSSYKSMTSLSAVKRNESGYTIDMTMGASFDYKEEDSPDLFTLYAVLPEKTSLRGYEIEEDIWNLITFNGFSLDRETLANHCTPTIIEDYQGSGRTYIALKFDFSDLHVKQNTSISASFTLDMDKSLFKDTKVNVYARSAVMLDEYVYAYGITEAPDDGNWDSNSAFSSDINNNGDTTEKLAYSYAYRNYIYADSSELSMLKSVKTTEIGYYTQLPNVPLAEYDSIYSYELTLQNGNSTATDLLIVDILETGENAKWQGTFVSIDISEAEEMGLTGKVYFSATDTPGKVGGEDWSTSMDPKDVRAVAVDFGDSELPAGKAINIYVYMKAPSDPKLKEEITENTFLSSFTMTDSSTGNVTRWDAMESNPVQVRLSPSLRNIIITKVDEKNNYPLKDAVYSLIDKATGETIATGITNIKGQIIFKDIPSDREYILREEESPYGYEMGEDIDIILNEDKNYRVTIEERREKGAVTLIKTNALHEQVKVEGAEYGLYTSYGTEIATGFTDAAGIVRFEELDWGTYYLKEKRAPHGYTVSDQTFNFTIDRKNVEEVKLFHATDEQDGQTSVKLKKYVATITGEKTEIPLSGAGFKLFLVQDGQYYPIGTYVTDANGEIVVEDLAYGTYEFREVRAPQGYEITKEQEFTLTADGKTADLTVYDKKKPGTIYLFKKDNLGNVIKGVVFELYDATKTKVLGTYTTNEAGVITIENLEWETYYLKEISTPEGYQLKQDYIEVQISGSKLSVDVEYINETKKGTVVLVKTDDTENNRLQGAVFNLYKNDGTLIADGLITDANGEIRVENLEWGSYYFKEMKAPVGYILSDETVRFTVNSINSGMVQTVTMTNSAEARAIIVTKKILASDINFSNGNPTFLFKITGTDASGNEHTYYRLVKFEEDYVKNNTDSKGYVSLTTSVLDIPAGTYTVTEEESSRYSLDEVTDLSDNAKLGADGKSAVIDIIEKQEGAATFVNGKYEHGGYSDNQDAINPIKLNAKYTALKASWIGGTVTAKAEIDKNLVKVWAVYDDGSVKVIDAKDWSIGSDYYGTAFPNINGEYSIPVTYTENGITRTGFFEVTLTGAVEKSPLRLEASVKEFYTYVGLNSKITEDMFDVTVIYDDLSSNTITESEYSIDRTVAPDAEGVFEVTIFLDETDIDVSVNMTAKDFPLLVKGSTFVSKIPSGITSVVFTNEIAPSGVSLTKLAADGSDSIVGWKVGKVWKVSTQEYGIRIKANPDCSGMFYEKKSLQSIDCSNLDTSAVTDMSCMFYYCQRLQTLDISGFDTSNVTNMREMFRRCNQITKLDVSGFDTSKVTDMSYMFSQCVRLEEVDVSGFDTSAVTDMSYMFNYCQRLQTLDVSGFDTSNVTNMSHMFNYCTKLTELDVSGFDTSNVTDMSDMFGYCSQLTELDVSGFDTSNVTDMSGMFLSCQRLKALDVSGFDTSKVTNMASMFSRCSALTELDVSGFDTSSVTNMAAMFSNTRMKELDVSGFNTSKVKSMAQMFNGCNAEELDVSEFDTSNVTDMSYMFNGCEVTELDVSSFDTSKVTEMYYMFANSKLTKLDLSGFDTSKVTNMDNMFYYCEDLKELDVSNFNTSKVTSMAYMFYRCRNLTKLDVSGFDTSNVGNMEYMFCICSSLTELDVSGFNTSKVTDMEAMFSSCKNLTSLDVSSFNTSRVVYMSYMFNACEKLTELDLSNFNTSSLQFMGEMFCNCSSLTVLDLSSFNCSSLKESNALYQNRDVCDGCTNLQYAYARTQADADKLNSISGNSNIVFVVKANN